MNSSCTVRFVDGVSLFEHKEGSYVYPYSRVSEVANNVISDLSAILCMLYVHMVNSRTFGAQTDCVVSTASSWKISDFCVNDSIARPLLTYGIYNRVTSG